MVAPDSHRTAGIFAFHEHLPQVDHRVTIGEGFTPLIELPRLAGELGLARILAKLEGANPTGSYKDRIAAMSISLACDNGNKGWIATSSGNAGASLAAYGAKAGLPGYLFVEPKIPREKLLAILAYGVEVIRVNGVGLDGDPGRSEALFEVVQAAAARYELFMAVTAHEFNPDGMRGADTIGFEISAEDAEAVYVPTGGGGLAAAIGNGLKTFGSGAPLVVAQPSGCAPVVQYLRGEIDEPIVDRCTTHVSALQLMSPPDGELAAEVVRRSSGWGTSCSDDEILESQSLLARTEGLFVEPASATAVAALKCDIEDGRVSADDSVVVIMTATGLKNLDAVERRSTSPALVEVEEIAGLLATLV